MISVRTTRSWSTATTNSPNGVVALHLYDPNHHDHDDVTLAFNVNVGAGAVDDVHGGRRGVRDDHTTFGFFRTSYQHVEPPAALTSGIPRVVYAAAVNHIHEISLPGDGHWSSGQPAGSADPPPPAGSAMGYVSPASDTARVIYRSADGHVQELSLAAGSDWSVGDLSTITSAPRPTPILSATYHRTGVASGWRPHRPRRAALSTWARTDTSTSSACPPAAAGLRLISPRRPGRPWPQGGRWDTSVRSAASRVVYRRGRTHLRTAPDVVQHVGVRRSRFLVRCCDRGG